MVFFFFIEKVHILRITHFSETTKDRNLIFGMGGDTNVKLCIHHFLSLGLCTFSIKKKKTMILQEKNNRLI
jgi:hypothetical protein